ncbi:MAG: transcriptional regulator, partial [Bacteroidota bacterium]
FEELKKQNLALKSDHKNFDEHINLLLELALLTLDDWTPAISLTIKNTIENPKKNQKELATILRKSQGNISEELNRGGFDVLQKLLRFYIDQLHTL